MHKLGQILHFDEKGLRSQLILSPKWAVNGVYAFLADASIADNSGRFTEQQFLKILKTKGYSRTDADLILQLMTRNHFDICYKSKNREDYVAAQLLPDNRPPQYIWYPQKRAEYSPLQFRYQYTVMPKGLISRLIVRLSEHIERINNVEVVWKKGVILLFEKDGQTCRVKIHEDDAESKTSLKQINIEVVGDMRYRKYALHIVRNEVNELHKKWFRNIQADEMVPCCCDECRNSKEPTLFKLGILLNLQKKAPNALKQCDNSYEMIPIVRLLEGVYEADEIKAFGEGGHQRRGEG